MMADSQTIYEKMKNDKQKELKKNQISHLLKSIGQLEFINKKLSTIKQIIESFEMKMEMEFGIKNSQLLQKEIQNQEKIINELITTQQQIQTDDINNEKKLNVHLDLLAASNEQVEMLNEYVVKLKIEVKNLETINQKLQDDNQKLIKVFNEKIKSAQENVQQDNLNLLITNKELILKNELQEIQINTLYSMIIMIESKYQQCLQEIALLKQENFELNQGQVEQKNKNNNYEVAIKALEQKTIKQDEELEKLKAYNLEQEAWKSVQEAKNLEYEAWKSVQKAKNLEQDATIVRTQLITNFIIHYATEVKLYKNVLEFNDDEDNKSKNRKELAQYVKDRLKIEPQDWSFLRQQKNKRNNKQHPDHNFIKKNTKFIFEQVFLDDDKEILDAYQAIFKYLYPDTQKENQ